MALILLSFGLQAQTISGMVQSIDGKPLQYVNVVLRMRQDSTYINGAVTDAEGRYSIPLGEVEAHRSCFLTFSLLGYESQSISPIPSSKINIQLVERSDRLGEVVVQARRRAITLEPDGQKIDVRKIGLSEIGSVFDLLGLLPGLSVRGDAISVVGRGKPLVYLNGRKLEDLSVLVRYESKDIISVKVVNNPGARYASTARAVVEITTRNPQDGLGGYALVQGSLGHKWGTRQVVSLIHKRGATDWFATLTGSIAQSKPSMIVDMSLPIMGQTGVKVRSNQEEYTRSHYLMTGINHSIGKASAIGVRYGLSLKPKMSSDGSIHSLIEQAGNTRREEQVSDYTSKSHRHDINAYWIGQITPAYTLRYDMNYLYTREEAINNFSVTSLSGGGLHQTDLHSHSWLISGRLQNIIALGWASHLTIGAEGAYTNNNQTHVATLQTLNQAQSEIQNQLYGLYASYSKAFGAFMGEVGLRYEHNRYDYYEYGQKMNDQSKRYNDLTPSFQIAYQGAMALSLSYRTMTTRPSYNMLSDRHQYNNEYLYESGNKYLKPKRTETLSLGMQWRDLSLGIDYNHTRDDYYYGTLFDAQRGVAISSPHNIPHTYSLLLQGQWAPTFGVWRPTVMAVLNKPFVKFASQSYNEPSLTLIVRSLVNLKRQGLSLSLNGTFFTGGSQELAEASAMYQVDFLANKTLLKGKMRLSLGVDDIFDSARMKAHMRAGDFALSLLQRQDLRKVHLTLRYFLPSKKNRYSGEASSSELRRL